MDKERDNSIEYVGGALKESYVSGTETAKTAFDSLRVEAERVQNTPYSFSKGNIFEFLEGGKQKILSAQHGRKLTFEPVSAGRGYYQSDEDLIAFDSDNTKILFQAKVSDNPDFIIKQFCREKYHGMIRVTTTDMYQPVKDALEKKLANNTITQEELDVLKNLRPGYYDPVTKTIARVSNSELSALEGPNHKVDLLKIEQYIKAQQNKAFLEECINNTESVVLTSVVFSGTISTVSNVYKYATNQQDIQTTAKNIGSDVGKAAGHGLLSSTIANGIKYVAFKGDIGFLRGNVNSLILANGFIDLGKSFYLFKKGEISTNDLIVNIIGYTSLAVVNLMLNVALRGHPFVKLATAVGVNIVGRKLISAFGKKDDGQLLNQELAIEVQDETLKRLKQANLELKEEISKNTELLNSISSLFENALSEQLLGDNLPLVWETLGLSE